MTSLKDFELRPNFEGEGVPENVKKLISTIPQEMFFLKPKSHLDDQQQQKIKRVHIEKLIENVQKIKKQKEEPKPEPEIKIEEPPKETKEEEPKVEEVEEPQKSQEEIEKQQQFAKKLSNFIQQTLQKPPDTLLHAFYRPGVDHFVTLHILKEFETKGIIPVVKQELDEEAAMQQYLEQKREKELEEAKLKEQQAAEEVKIDIALPDMKMLKEKLGEDPSKLKKALDEALEEKNRFFEKMNEKMKQERLLTLLEIHDYLMKRQKGSLISKKERKPKFSFMEENEAVSGNEWSDYLFKYYIRNGEKQLFEKLQKEHADLFKDISKRLKHLDSLKTEDEKLKYQWDHPVIRDKWTEVIRSKL